MEAKLDYGFGRVFRHFVLRYASHSCILPSKARIFLYRVAGLDVGKNCFIGSDIYFDELNLKGIHIGEHVVLTRGGVYLSYFLNSKNGCFELGDIYIEKDAFIGANVIITKPVRIGKNSIVGAGSVVTKDIPDNVIAAGNPCKVIKERV